MVSVTVYLRVGIEERLDRARKETGKLRGAIISEAIADWLEKEGFM